MPVEPGKTKGAPVVPSTQTLDIEEAEVPNVVVYTGRPHATNHAHRRRATDRVRNCGLKRRNRHRQ